MDLANLNEMVKRGESDTLEFKKSTAQLRAAFQTICGFLNANGGAILIGVSDNGEMIGQNVNDNTRLEIARELKKIEPTPCVGVQYTKCGGSKFIIALQVEKGEHAPYLYDGRAFQRDESSTSRMSQHRYEQLLVERNQLNHSWEEVIASDYTIDDLDQDEIYKTISDGIHENRIPASAQRESVYEISDRLGLVKGTLLRRAAVVLYAKQQSMKYFQCMIKMARFRGMDKLGDFIDNQQVCGNAFRLLEESETFLRRHIPIER